MQEISSERHLSLEESAVQLASQWAASVAAGSYSKTAVAWAFFRATPSTPHRLNGGDAAARLSAEGRFYLRSEAE